MGMGLLAAGALSGLGQAGLNIGQQMVKSALDESEREYLMGRQKAFNLEQKREEIAMKDEAETSSRTRMMNDINAEKELLVGKKTSPLYDEASQKIGLLSHLSEDEKAAALDAVSQNKGAEQGKLRGDLRTTIEAGINTGHIAPEKAAGLLKSDTSNDVKLAIAEGRINQLQDYLTFQRDKLATTDNTKRRGQDMRAETAENGQAARGASKQSGSSGIAQEKWDEAKIDKHMARQAQFYKFNDPLTSKPETNSEARGAYSSLIKRLGPEKADQLMLAAKTEAEAAAMGDDQSIDFSKFNTEYTQRMRAFASRLSGRK